MFRNWNGMLKSRLEMRRKSTQEITYIASRNLPRKANQAIFWLTEWIKSFQCTKRLLRGSNLKRVLWTLFSRVIANKQNGLMVTHNLSWRPWKFTQNVSSKWLLGLTFSNRSVLRIRIYYFKSTNTSFANISWADISRVGATNYPGFLEETLENCLVWI